MSLFSLKSFRRVFDQALQDIFEFRPNGLELMEVMQGKFLQELLAAVSELNQHLTPIVGGPQAEQESPFHESINETYRAVRLKLHSLC